MNHYLHFTFEIFSKFINYSFSEEIELNPLIPDDYGDYILYNLLFYKNIGIFDLSNINKDEVKLQFHLSYEKVNEMLYKLLPSSLKEKTSQVISNEMYIKIMLLNNELQTLLQTQTIESIISKVYSDPIDHGFEYDYQNTITQAILWCITSITNWLNFSMIELKDVLFVKDCLYPKNYTLTDEYIETNKALLQPIIESILIKHDFYITSEASDELCKLWIQLNNNPISLRLLCFDQF